MTEQTTRPATLQDADIAAVVEATEEAFGAALVNTFPRARSGDIDPVASFRLSEALADAARSWVHANVAPTLTIRNDFADDVRCSCGNEVHLDGFYACDGFGVVFPDGGIPAGYKGASLYQCGRCGAVYHEAPGLRSGDVIVGEYL